MKVVFILGSGHCGSTLLDLLLGSHSEIVGLGETESIGNNSMCTCGSSIRECVFWNKVLPSDYPACLRVYRKKIWFLLNSRNFYFKRCKAWENTNADIRKWIKDVNEKIYRRSLQVSASKVVIDSSKNPNKVELMAESENIQPIIVHLVRDGRAVTWSYEKKYGKMLPYAWKWFAENIKAEIVKCRSGTAFICVSYKDLVQDTEETLKKILAETDLKYETDMLNFKAQEYHQAEGNRMRFSKQKNIKKDEEWKEKMPIKDRIIFNILFGWLNVIYLFR